MKTIPEAQKYIEELRKAVEKANKDLVAFDGSSHAEDILAGTAHACYCALEAAEKMFKILEPYLDATKVDGQ